MEATIVFVTIWILMEIDTVFHQSWETDDFKTDILYTTKKKKMPIKPWHGTDW